MSIGIWQIVLILAIVLILFGAGKIPRVMGDVAKGIKSFKSGMKEEESSEEVDKDDVVSSVKKETDTKSNKGSKSS
ncbi:twin-arginine translocase TatA/TatE family subunit [Alphaproteobacteria bacterium]|jgi:sec-independent protein translocase protein TatA|nr:twin-arginine translocase TatA/TatE family subunit [Alphaproteobacteria bacterium]